MTRKWLPFLLILLVALAVIITKRWQAEKIPKPRPTRTQTEIRSGEEPVNRDRGFDRRIAYLKYSSHAKCRMDCRRISQAEVEEIMQDGKINYRKSDLDNSRCPRYALEGRTSDEQRVRIVYAQCNESTTVVTVIDLEKEWSCDCPGDDRNFNNRN